MIKHAPTGACYVGKTIDPDRRWRVHKRDALAGSDDAPHLYRAIRKHGIDQFEFNIDREYASEDLAFAREIELIAELKQNGVQLFNVSGGGRGGTRTSDETREKQRQSQLQRWSDPDERERMSIRCKEVWADPALLAEHSERQRAWASTDGARRKNSEAQRRPDVVDRKRESMQQAWKDPARSTAWSHVKTEEFAEFHSQRQQSAWADPVQRQKMLEGMRRPEVKQRQSELTSYENNPRAKLTWDVVDAIRADHAAGVTMKQLEDKYSIVSYQTLRRIIRGDAWVR